MLKISAAGKAFGEKIVSNDVINMEYRDTTIPAPVLGTEEKFSCFDKKGSTDRCSKQTPCNVNNGNNIPSRTCQQTQFIIKKVPLPTR